MASHNIVAIYASRAVAERARDHLIDSGFDRQNVRISADHNNAVRRDSQTSADDNEGFFGWLFGSGINDDDRQLYDTHVQGDRTAVSVMTDESRLEQVEDMLDQFSPIDLQDQSPSSVAGASVGAASMGQSKPSGARGDDQSEQVIPIMQEQLDVGKRTVERRHRIRTHVIEQPVEEQVHLKSERVVIERRPATGRTVQGDMPSDKDTDIEIIERHEEPVVSKSARAVEEVVVSKTQSDRVETVRGSVGRTEVEIDGEEATDADRKKNPGKPRV